MGTTTYPLPARTFLLISCCRGCFFINKENVTCCIRCVGVPLHHFFLPFVIFLFMPGFIPSFLGWFCSPFPVLFWFIHSSSNPAVPRQSLSPTTFGLRFGSQLHLPCDLSASKLLPTISHIAIEALNPQEQALGTQALSGLHIIHLSGKSWQIIGEKKRHTSPALH